VLHQPHPCLVCNIYLASRRSFIACMVCALQFWSFLTDMSGEQVDQPKHSKQTWRLQQPGRLPCCISHNETLMMKGIVCEINTELVIPASPEQVWAVFGDFANWGQWNDFMVLPVAPEKVGKCCRVMFRLDGGCVRKSVHDPEVKQDDSMLVAVNATQQFLNTSETLAACNCSSTLPSINMDYMQYSGS